MSLIKNASRRTRKNRARVGITVLSALVKKYCKKISDEKSPWEKHSVENKATFLSEEEFDFDIQLRCPNCNKLLAKIKVGSALNMMDNTDPPIIETKCTKSGNKFRCGMLSRHTILKDSKLMGRRIKIPNNKNDKGEINEDRRETAT